MSITNATPRYENFPSLTVSDAQQVIASAKRDDYATVEKFISGDHWQDGDGWVGPMPQQTEVGYAETKQQIERAFTSHNVMLEVVERHMAAIVGREPRWELTPRRALRQDEEPSDTEKRLIDEAEAFLTDWWDNGKIHYKLQQSTTTLLWAEKSVLRLYVPRGLLRSATRGDGQRVSFIDAATIDEALRLIYLSHPTCTQATVYTDPDTMRELGLYTWVETEGTNGLETTWVSPTGMTIIRSVVGNSDRSFAFNLGGRMPIHMMGRESLINTQVIQNQKALNLALSMSPRNVVTGGFLERVLLNAQMPGEWQVDEAGDRVKFIPEPYYTGSGTTNFVRGVDYTDADGNTKLANPNIVWREPIDVEPSLTAKEAHKLAILDEADQAHILTTSSQYQSGKSKEQARADFMASLNITRNHIDAAGRWLIETALAMAEQFVGEPGRYTKTLRVVFNSKPDYGPLNSDERTALNEAMEKGVISRERNMYLQGVDDIDAELAKMNHEQIGKLALVTKQMEVISAATTAGLGMDAACELAGIKGEMRDIMVQSAETAKEEAMTQEQELMDAAARAKASNSSPQ